MKRISALFAIVLLLCGVAQADEANWTWNFGRARFGTNVTASNSYGTEDVRIADTWSTYVATYHDQNQDGLLGDAGFYSSDIRAPLTILPGQSKTWTFLLWQKPTATTVLELMWGYNLPSPAFDTMEYRLTYLRAAEGVTGGNIPVGTSILLNDYRQGTWSFPAYRTENGLTGYMFELKATVIPEPSSLAALCMLMTPLLGFRRRPTHVNHESNK